MTRLELCRACKHFKHLDKREVRIISTGMVLGNVVQNRFGWRFIPRTTAHTSSRKNHLTAEKAIPAWVKRWAAQN